jgi:thiol-disulfide isomerase/thioredoxin
MTLRNTINLLIAIILSALFSCQTETRKLQEGYWRGVFIVNDYDIPFIFEAKDNKDGHTSIYLINGEDRFEVDKIEYKGDSVIISIDLFNRAIKAKYTENSLNGKLIRVNSENPDQGIPLSAEYGISEKFPENGEVPSVSLDGTWDMEIGSSNNINIAVGIFGQNGSLLEGSILTTTGDYRFLEGIVHGNEFSLSSFGGSSPYLVQGKFNSDNSFEGVLVTTSRVVNIKGIRNQEAKLPDAYNITSLKEGYSSIEFSFPDLNGKNISLSDPAYKDKIVIVSIMGSWCPNCLDENAFLSEWYTKNRDRGVEIIALGFELKNDFKSAKKSLTSLKNRLGIEYEILFAGTTSKESVAKALPALNGIASFPTTIFIGRNGNVRKIHSGFSGPATGKFYEEFITKFNAIVDQLLAEK